MAGATWAARWCRSPPIRSRYDRSSHRPIAVRRLRPSRRRAGPRRRRTSCDPGHRRDRSRPAHPTGRSHGGRRRDRRGAHPRKRQRPAGNGARRCRRAAAVPPERFALGQSDQPGAVAARDRRQCVQPGAADPGWRAAGGPVRRLGALPRLCHRSYRPDPRDARRWQRLFRTRRARWHDRDRQRRSRRSAYACRRPRVRQPPVALRCRIGSAAP